MKNIFLILFYFAGILYCYGNLYNNNLISSIGLYSIVPLILIHYLTTNKNKFNFLYVIALISSYVGIIFFYSNDVRVNIPALTGFSLFNLIIMLIVQEKMELVNFKKIITIASILLMIFLIVTYKIFNFIDVKFFAVAIYFTSLSLLIAFCYTFLSESKSKISLYFFVGVLSYILTSVSTEFLYLNKFTIIMTIINTVSYLITHYFYYKGLTTKAKNN